jgi:hypothetical protein
MTTHIFKSAVLTAILFNSALFCSAQTTNADPLKPFTLCKVPGDLKIKEVTRRTATDHYREVETDNGKQKVSIVDGYRVMFAYPDLPYYFANVKIEQSIPDHYLQDKETLVAQLKHFTTTKEATAMLFSDQTTLNGFEHYGLDRDKIDVGGQVAIHLLFYDPAHLVVTIYFLNQSTAVFLNNRRFESIKEFQQVRDSFLSSYSECLKGVADAQH